MSTELKTDLEDLRGLYTKISELLHADKLSEAVEEICTHYLPDEKFSDSERLKKETLLELAEESEDGVENFLEQMQLNPYTDAGRLKSEGIHLLTFHAAKGLEFPVVFIAGAEEGITPLDRDDVDIEEERRLFYVAMTRGKDELLITSTKERMRYGEILGREPSRFIFEIPDELMERVESEKSSIKRSDQPKNDQLGLF